MWTAVLALLAGAGARPVAIGGVVQAAAVESKVLAGGEALAVWTLPRLGVAVRNDPQDVRLLYGARELRFTPGRGWRAVGFTLAPGQKLGVPELAGGSLYVPLTAVRALGVRVIVDAPDLLDFAAPGAVPAATLPPSPDVGDTAALPAPPQPAPTPPPPAPAPTPPAPVTPAPPSPPVPPVVTAHLDTVRVSRTLHRTVEVQRVVLELSGQAPHQVVRESAGLSVVLPGVSATPSAQTLASGDTLSIEPGVQGNAAPPTAQTTVRLRTGGGTSEIFTLEDPYRVVIDTTTQLDRTVPPPIDPDALPDGVTYRVRGNLHLLSFDPARFQPRVVTAPLGAARDVASLVQSVGGVAGVNGGYFDPASSLPVDLVAVGGLMTAPSLEKRATIGFTAQGDPLFGYPRPRYVLQGPFGSVTVNTVGTKVRPELLTAFVGDGRSAVGTEGLTTLYLAPGGSTIARVSSGRNVPPAGTLAVTFDPARFPQLPRTAGQPLTASLNWQAQDAPWETALDALSAGPLLVQGGRVALNPGREVFDTSANIWRPTRQVAFGVLGGQPTIAYLENGTPEAFAAALAAAGVRDAVRLDSGSSATAYVTAGYANLGGYLNTVWSRPVPNAIVLVPKGQNARK
ncbi:phosphodiester glycosidase family protein [Deinococcus aluminii]|uniref:Phosphodiester glycosidase domain-containing protein n=1 Tax=Deinococcus aluminii TaxID=1656885 RepID=A0ABP9XIW8_9DEIO